MYRAKADAISLPNIVSSCVDLIMKDQELKEATGNVTMMQKFKKEFTPNGIPGVNGHQVAAIYEKFQTRLTELTKNMETVAEHRNEAFETLKRTWEESSIKSLSQHTQPAVEAGITVKQSANSS